MKSIRYKKYDGSTVCFIAKIKTQVLFLCNWFTAVVNFLVLLFINLFCLIKYFIGKPTLFRIYFKKSVMTPPNSALLMQNRVFVRGLVFQLLKALLLLLHWFFHAKFLKTIIIPPTSWENKLYGNFQKLGTHVLLIKILF